MPQPEPTPEPAPALQGSIRLFRVAGITVYMHWSWFLVAFIEIQTRDSAYSSKIWNVAEYVTLFGIVLLHEFGHALACRQVGGTADQIVLWPLGGIAYVRPPARPGAVLWAIAAGPLVNLILVPLTVIPYLLFVFSGTADLFDPDLEKFLHFITLMNVVLLIFNMLPIYPLDGGQILQALLWFVVGRAKSLMIVSVIGMVVGAIVCVLALVGGVVWYVILAGFVVMRSFAGFQQARALAKLLALPKHENAACPNCGAAALWGAFWACEQCGAPFDPFVQHGICPNCSHVQAETPCPMCGQASPLEAWLHQ
jgi:Zn-dependent protease